ncbi:hypothetical protein GCM10011409_25270 [Lentibacillus populi]|uniref:DUF4083 domain-containing protein n=1 Tax=Lentibacillus populi TaxID=1827502 RepID=A0A9W5TYK6_9BACI|nr:hypothetical protein GCM10011409_25270 [Lentibacillus populi]
MFFNIFLGDIIAQLVFLLFTVVIISLIVLRLKRKKQYNRLEDKIDKLMNHKEK